MGTGTTPHPPRRTWTVTLNPPSNDPGLHCTACGPLPHSAGTPPRNAALDHLGDHVHHTPLEPHLRTCQCREDGCRGHPRHRGCDGLVALYLTHHPTHRSWRLADLCHACATATPHTAKVPDLPQPPPPQRPSAPPPTGHSTSPNTPQDSPNDEEFEFHPWWTDDAPPYL
ncbi:hypothetical protein [Streptomyces macrosporus]|uniref:Uncharacterized protein n=1 Tax=Streptomyces macrosporus TaxID=44032 RepID=A0ABN3KK70_9ACTN